TVTDAAIGWVSRHLPVTGSLPSWPTTDPTLTGSAILPTLTTTVAPGTGDVAAPDRPTASPTATTAGITASSPPFFRVVDLCLIPFLLAGAEPDGRQIGRWCDSLVLLSSCQERVSWISLQ